jgi:hypothetical protein
LGTAETPQIRRGIALGTVNSDHSFRGAPSWAYPDRTDPNLNGDVTFSRDFKLPDFGELVVAMQWAADGDEAVELIASSS